MSELSVVRQELSEAEYETRELLAERSSLMSRAKILGFVPHEKQMDFIRHDTVKRKAAIGGNRAGKTALVVTEAGSHSWGCRPYFPRDHPNYRVLGTNGEPIPVPNQGLICGEDFPVGIGENLWVAWRKWMPKDSYRVLKHERSIPRVVAIDVSWCPWADKDHPDYPNSIIYVHAYQQGRAAFQGIRVDWILADEPMQEDIYEEMMRALIKSGGKWMGAMTIAEQTRTWIYDLFMPPKKRTGASSKIDARLGAEFRSQSYYMVPLSTWDNVVNEETGAGGLKAADIEEFAAGFDDPDKVDVRVHGKPLHLMGTEYGKYWDPDIHVVPDRERDPNSCYACFCDAHPTKPFAILWMEINEHDEWHIWAESYDERLDTISEIANHMKDIEGWKMLGEDKWSTVPGQWAPQIRFIDPLASSKEKGTGMTNIEDFAVNHQIYWAKWKRGALNQRIRVVKDWLKRGKGPTARPRLTIAESCEEIIFQMPRFREKMPKQPAEQPRTGVTLDVDADLVQCVIAAANCGLGFHALHQMIQGTTVKQTSGKKPAHSTAGYSGWRERNESDDELELNLGDSR